MRNNPPEYDAEAIERQLEELERKFGTLMPSEFCSRRRFIENWENAPYTKSTLTVSGQKTYRTEKGETVRSKLECIVANILHHLHIPYRYEAQLVLINGRAVFPDFTILSPVNGRIYYLEVCGMMETAAYVDGLLQRVRELSDSGISIGDNLLLCFESMNCPFDTQGLISMLQRSVLTR